MIKKCPYATNFRLDKCIKLLDWLEKKRDKLDSPVKKRGVESIIKNLDLKQKPFYVLLATILSLRTRDQTTYQSAKKLFEKIKKPEDILKLPEKELEKLIYPAGFYKTKAKNIKKLSKILIEKYGGKVPNNLEDLLKLPGVGLKTANLVLSIGFGKESICVDTHVHRICNRLGIVNTKTPEETEKKLKEILPKQYWKKINKLLIAFGQTICKPTYPNCKNCPIYKKII